MYNKTTKSRNIKPEGDRDSTRLYVTGEYAISRTVILTDYIVLHHWFVALMGIAINIRFFLWLATL